MTSKQDQAARDRVQAALDRQRAQQEAAQRVAAARAKAAADQEAARKRIDSSVKKKGGSG